ncbi:gamma carbonic anhydrase family protein [Methylococcus sp. EFPC2]|uniref:gamma carbonic anhydrase family protein n=1 Tax=Methylococcus sp. EFPC2 TaxID=2812648 RepID=UPI001968873A|nr:gamma carbonic anhydrase family protein [Methylococcus sp. EFPC2]QSA99145.1 gamma carbonic anhydrase family protein [Methylococcus sp. EFPC2]
MAIKAYRGVWPSLGHAVYVDDSALVIGDVTLGDHVSIWPMSVVRGDVQRIRIGEGSNIQDGCVLHVTHGGSEFSAVGHPLTVGRHVTVGHRAVLHGCAIGDHCLIGIGAIVMDGAVVEDEVMLGAGSLVPPGKRLESGFLYVGSPAKQARALTDQEKAYLRFSPRHYVELKDAYLSRGE